MNKIRIAGAAAGVVLVSGVVLQVSSAAFTDTTDNTGNSWAAGTVSLTDDDAGQALYVSETNLIPGYTEVQCIEVTYAGSVALTTPIDLYAAVTSTPGGEDVTTDNGLADDLDVQVDIGTAGTTCTQLEDTTTIPLLGDLTAAASATNIFDGTLATFNAEADALSTTWTPTTQNEKRAFRFVVTLGDDTQNEAQGDAATANFTWFATS